MSVNSEVRPICDAELRRNYILASALFHTQISADQIRANCFRVLQHALMAAGLWDQDLEARRSEAFHDAQDFPVLRLWYETLIDLTRQEPASERLLEGAGNLAGRAGAYFTACWLTPAGRRVAEKLLAEHPEWRPKLMRQDSSQPLP